MISRAHGAGVRYPAQLLGDVVATLSKAQELISAPGQADGGPVLQKSTLEAAAMGAGGAVRHEKPTPIDKKSLAKALRSAIPLLTCFSWHDLLIERPMPIGKKSLAKALRQGITPLACLSWREQMNTWALMLFCCPEVTRGGRGGRKRSDQDVAHTSWFNLFHKYIYPDVNHVQPHCTMHDLNDHHTSVGNLQRSMHTA